MARQEMVIFTRTFDFLTWLLPVTNNFPRAHRHTFTRRLLDAAFDLRERLEEANHRQGQARLERLEQADEALDLVRVYLRLAVRWDWLSGGQYRHVAEMVTEIGRLLGGWQKTTRREIGAYAEAGQTSVGASLGARPGG
jgi:four helix bundle protein